MKLYHNPRCSKSREAKKLLEENNESFTVIEYLQSPLSVSELRDLCTLLGISPSSLLRTKEKEYEELVKKEGEPSDEQVLIWMSEHPALMERPILVHNNKAVVARPAKRVLELL